MSTKRPSAYQSPKGEDGMEALSAKLSADLRGSIRALVRRGKGARKPIDKFLFAGGK